MTRLLLALAGFAVGFVLTRRRETPDDLKRRAYQVEAKKLWEQGVTLRVMWRNGRSTMVGGKHLSGTEDGLKVEGYYGLGVAGGPIADSAYRILTWKEISHFDLVKGPR